MSVPSGPVAGAAVTAVALARIVDAARRAAPLPDADAAAAATALARLLRIDAPRAASREDIAALGSTLVATLQSLARAADPGLVAPILFAVARRAPAAAPRSASPVLTRDYALARALACAVEAAAFGEAFLAEARSEHGDRQAASDARDRIAVATDGASDRIAAHLGERVLTVLAAAARECSTALIRAAANLQPIVRVEAARSFPSTALAWSLYADPQRGGDLVRRNRVGTPLFMPASFEALAPAA